MTPVIATAPLFLWLGFGDPAPGLTQSKAEAQRLECQRYDVWAASRERPGVVAEERARGDWFERRVLVCTEKVLAPGVRRAQDEAILTDLDVRARELASAAAATRPDLAEATWLVETHYPNPSVSTKIAFATKNGLMALGLPVSDRTPTVAVGDVEVLTRMPPLEAHPAACKRYAANGTLGEGVVLLSVILVDPDGTGLHGGLCEQGRWTWLR